MSVEQELGRLGAQLGGAEPPESFRDLDAAELALLVDALRAERARQDGGLNEAAEEALKLVPALARGAVRKVLFR
ncbi:hypothetical protein J7E99_24315 [Streptomyces sp. ISL-44]|uniref:hypothetical protein n=1 Tax=unclassified Streptomyces TaxID=2593676 RepID=UPI001BEBDAB8|nr:MULTISPECIES: hypothetical protein [unclassified Streptomyces]MBT2543733.1 hypothetical protein [Streptomyces sp. ISL-44]MCX5014489.1 hypothetical protein [Streptomyces sp. NBC_00555]UUU42495.1 hypothetical protein JIW86_28975 [Streptomyces sp. NBC_00162]